MGIYHLSSLGISPGAVTSGLMHIVHQYGRHHLQYGDMVEAVVLFTSPEVDNGQMKSRSARRNNYLSTTGRKTWPETMTNAVEITREFIRRELPEAQVYVVRVDVNDYERCFEVVGRAVLKFHAPEQTGKHLWVHITGGTNFVNTALSQITYLTGVISRMYYTFVANMREHGDFLQPFSADTGQFRYGEIFTFKTRLGLRQFELLETLEAFGCDSWLTGEELRGLAAQSYPDHFDKEKMSPSAFRRDFLNVMDGRGIERKGDRITGQEDLVRLSDYGANLLAYVRRPLFKALVDRERPEDVVLQELLAELDIKLLD